jgi:hypothetical protein
MHQNVSLYVDYIVMIQNCQIETQVASGAMRCFYFALDACAHELNASPSSCLPVCSFGVQRLTEPRHTVCQALL